MVYMPVKMDGNETLSEDEVRCVNQNGELLWSCVIPAGRLPWGGPRMLSDGRFGLINARDDGKRYLETISKDGKFLQSQVLPDKLVPLVLAGDAVYGTLQGADEHKMYQIGLDGQAKDIAFDAAHPNATVLWTWPKGEGSILFIVGKVSQEEDLYQRVGPQWLLYLDAQGQPTNRVAWLPNRNLIFGFQYDAALNHLGGLTALGSGNNGKDTQSTFSIHTYAPNEETLTDWYYAINASAVRPQLIDQRPDGGYTVWGSGKMSEDDSSGFVFRMEVDKDGQVQEISGRSAEGCGMVRYLDEQPYVYYSFGPQSWVAPFDALPEMELEVNVLTLDDHG